ncbi:GPI ethanolamine phosphate transferase 1-like [Trichogramma pretiosum]|uniref:GPI ethanolamine phosphate transferase 1-like n=1 Tax=Trichogramma pretiosum TaxID=7493 RepID=UPI0006C94DBE|nr:GPI ethanolamine phosphate transferase 1-like [Trichogramma pretiosum]
MKMNVIMRVKKLLYSRSHIFIILWGFVMHIILLYGVLDANFHSPIISELPSVPMPKGPPAKRVLIFVADGLRFRTFKNHIPPYLNSVIEHQGVWGISHTRMPTESRPGNIAIVAGLYEDPSAVFKGWKENPVDFDSVFNQSYASWLWGSPDIISLFTKGSQNNIHGASYPASWQDFNNNFDSFKRLDDWVFNEYWKWLTNEAYNYKAQDKIILFFHLLGCDTTGHSAKPQSKDYVEIMMALDRNIKNVVQETEEYFGYGTTSYIFTSDHGMTDWGSHGSGSTDETETPFVAWGAGIKKKAQFYNIEQADITPLISTLVGIPYPRNNEGILPIEILDDNYQKYIANAFFTNAKQLAEQVKANRELMVGRSLANIYNKDKELSQKLFTTEQFLQEGKIVQAIKDTNLSTKLAKQALTYYRNYLSQRFLCCMLIMWISWIIILFLDLSSVPKEFIEPIWNYVIIIGLIGITVPLVLEYAVAGCKDGRLLGYGLICNFSVWIAIKKIISNEISFDMTSKKPLREFVSILGITIMMIVGLYYRWTFSISMIIVVFLLRTIFEKSTNHRLTITGVALSVFPLFPVVGPVPRVYLVLVAIFIGMVVVMKQKRLNKCIKVIEIIRLCLTSVLTLNIIDGKSCLSWFLLFTTPLVICLHPREWDRRIIGITMALLSPLALLSASHEPMFFLILSAHLQQWPIHVNAERCSSNSKRMNLSNFSVASILMMYTLICFFGTGNMASLSSFDPTWTRHFLTIFSPFTMTTLILIKIMIPLILVGCLIQAMARETTIFSSVLLLGDFLAIPLMFGITNQGSWLDIGSSISRFVIAISLPCLLVIVYYLSKPLTAFSLINCGRHYSISNQRLKI